MKKEIIAMLLAGGQGSRLGILTSNIAKPAVAFGGKYRIIDFPLSNCINSGIDTVGVLTQYQPLELNSHIGIGIPWDLDRNNGGVTVLPPYERGGSSQWYSGTANAIFQNINYIENYNPTYVVILSGDHIYKMDYGKMLDFHKENGADITLATIPVPLEEAHRFGIVLTDENDRVTGFEEKPEHPQSDLASMGIYIFTWEHLREQLILLKDIQGCDFGKHIIPDSFNKGKRVFAYRFNDYWRDVGTLESYWAANMELIDIVPEFNLYEEYWKIYTSQDSLNPQYISGTADVRRTIVGVGANIYGKVESSVLSPGVIIEEGAEVFDSIIMRDTVIKAGTKVYKSIIAEGCEIGRNCILGDGYEAPNELNAEIYTHGIVTIGSGSVIPDGVTIGKNTVIHGETTLEDYDNKYLQSGGYLIK